MTPGQMQMTAEAIYDTYSLKVADLAYFFNQVKNGTYGEFYENLSREKIMSWLQKYYDDRCEIAQFVSNKKHDGFSATKDKVHPDVIDKMFQDTGKDKIVHYHERNGIGSRNRAIFNADMLTIVKSLSRNKLEEYIDDLKKGKSGSCNVEQYNILKNELQNRRII